MKMPVARPWWIGAAGSTFLGTRDDSSFLSARYGAGSVFPYHGRRDVHDFLFREFGLLFQLQDRLARNRLAR